MADTSSQASGQSSAESQSQGPGSRDRQGRDDAPEGTPGAGAPEADDGTADMPPTHTAEGGRTRQRPSRARVTFRASAESSSETVKTAAKVISIAAIAVLVVVRFDDVLNILGIIWSVLSPLLAGAILAYLLNLISSRLEHVVMPNVKSHPLELLRRGICIVLTLLIIVAFVAIVVNLVKDEIASAFGALASGITTLVDMIQELLASGDVGESETLEEIAALLSGDVSAWQESLSVLLEDIGGIGGVATTAVNMVSSAATTIVDVIIAIVFSLYVVADKERVLSGCRMFGHWMFRGDDYGKAHHVAMTANYCFSHFIGGQCIEATILGTLCGIGMAIFGMPYAASIGFIVGLTSLVPLVGSWLGGIIGALMIISVDPIQAIWFIVWLVTLQQIEGHVIYPNVVGNIIKVPGIWVLVSVFIGGTLFGVIGILMGVPLVATIRTLVKEYREAHGMDSDDSDFVPPSQTVPESDAETRL